MYAYTDRPNKAEAREKAMYKTKAEAALVLTRGTFLREHLHTCVHTYTSLHIYI